jgi:hypothetical protein
MGMDSADREHLRIVIAVALACVPRTVKKAFADRFDPRTAAAKKQLAEAVTAAVEQTFTLERKAAAAASARRAGVAGRGPMISAAEKHLRKTSSSDRHT